MLFKPHEKINKGFTLVELLITLAIIGILASIAMASLQYARGKGGNASVRTNLSGIRSQAEIYFSDHNQDFTGFCTDPNVISAMNAAILAGGDTGSVATRCNSDTSNWAINVQLRLQEDTSIYWCIDTSGAAKGEPSELSGATSCA